MERFNETFGNPSRSIQKSSNSIYIIDSNQLSKHGEPSDSSKTRAKSTISKSARYRKRERHRPTFTYTPPPPLQFPSIMENKRVCRKKYTTTRLIKLYIYATPTIFQDSTQEVGARRCHHEQQQVRFVIRRDNERGPVALCRARRREGLRGRAQGQNHKDLRAQRLHVSSHGDILYGESGCWPSSGEFYFFAPSFFLGRGYCRRPISSEADRCFFFAEQAGWKLVEMANPAWFKFPHPRAGNLFLDFWLFVELWPDLVCRHSESWLGVEIDKLLFRWKGTGVKSYCLFRYISDYFARASQN